jgi:hypothetical protein
MQHNGWDRALRVTADGTGLVGHAGAILLRKAADQTSLTAQLSAALRKKGTSPLLDRGIVLVSVAVSITLGATSMSDIALLAHLAPVLGAAPSGPTVRRALDLAGAPAMLGKIARARAKARAHAWALIAGTAAGFPWLVIAGKTLTGWIVIDMDATLVTACSDKEGAASTWKKGYGFHPLGAWCRNTRECLAMLLRPGNAGSNTFTDHEEVLAAALRQVPSRFRRKIMVRVDGAGASHALIGHLLSLSSPRRIMLFTCGWTIMPAVKGSQPKLQKAIFGAIQAGGPREPDHTELDRGHGRTVRRSIWVAGAGGIDFPHVSRIARIRRDRYDTDGQLISKEIVHAVTSLGTGQASAAGLSKIARGQWAIESVHWVRDTAYAEDSNTAYAGNGPQIMAGLRNLAISLLYLNGVKEITRTLQAIARDRNRILDYLPL